MQARARFDWKHFSSKWKNVVKIEEQQTTETFHQREYQLNLNVVENDEMVEYFI